MAANERIPSDSDLLRAIQNGNEQARLSCLSELVKRHDARLSQTIFGYLWRKNCDQVAAHAAGVKSNTWLNIADHIIDLEDVLKFKAWSATIAINEANKHLKKCIKGQNYSVELKDESLLPPARLTDYYTSRDAAIDAARILEFAESISPEFAQIFRLYVVEGLSFDEIAKRLGQNREQLRTCFYRGRRSVMERFRNQRE